MLGRLEKSLIPLILLGTLASMIHYSEGFMYRFKLLNRISKSGQNPYLDDMHFESEEQKDLYRKSWFPPISERVVVYLIDALPFYMAIPGGEREGDHNTSGGSRQLKEQSRELLTKENQEQARMKSIDSLIKTEPNNTILLCSVVEGYTWTSTRVKALATGTIPGPVDILGNVGALGLKQDNLFKQLRGQNQSSLAFGDNIWNKFFGNSIDNTTDIGGFEETIEKSPLIQRQIVNIMKEASSEKKSADYLEWNFLIFHDPAFDFVMHYGEIFSFPDFTNNSIFNEAVHKVDLNTGEILSAADFNTTIFIISDHGFSSDTGFHGGTTMDEQGSLFFAYNKNGFLLDRNISQIMNRNSAKSQVDQIDFLATVCMLKGISIPANNVGVIIPDAFVGLPWVTNAVIANAYYTNLRQIEDYFSETRRKFGFPSKKTFESIISQFNLSKNEYNNLFLTPSISDQSLRSFITQVRHISSLVKISIIKESPSFYTNYSQMKLATVTIVLLTILSLGASIILNSSLSPLSKAFNSFFSAGRSFTLYKIILPLMMFICFIAYFSGIVSFLGFINLILVNVSLIFIGHLITFVHFSLNQLFKKLVSWESSVSIMLVSFMAISIACVLSSNDLFFSLDSYCLLIIAVVLLVIVLKMIFQHHSGIQLKILFKALLILLFLHFAIYFDPNILLFKTYMQRKFLNSTLLSSFFADPLLNTRLPLVVFAFFYSARIRSCSFPTKNFKLIIYTIHSIIVGLLAIYFLLRKNYLDERFFFENLFPLTIYLLIIVQVFFLAFTKVQTTFINKYTLFFYSLLPSFMLFIDNCSIIQIVLFFTCISYFQDILSYMKYRQNILLYAFVQVLLLFFYIASGHGFQIQQVQVNTSQLGLYFYSHLLEVLNTLIANIAWFIIAFLYFPILFLHQYLADVSANSFSPQFLSVPHDHDSPEYVSSTEQLGSEVHDAPGEERNISLSDFRTSLIQNILQFSLLQFAGIISNFLRNLVVNTFDETDYFIFMFFIEFAVLLFFSIASVITWMFSERLYYSFKAHRNQTKQITPDAKFPSSNQLQELSSELGFHQERLP